MHNTNSCSIAKEICLPSDGLKESTPFDFLYQSMIRPTNGEMSVAPTSAHAIAWAIEKMRVTLQVIPSFSKTLAA